MIIKLLFEKFNSIKICAVFTTICFIVSALGANLYAIPIAEDINQKYEDVFNKANGISNEYGKITSSMDAKSDITVINIQDLHCHPQTQRNIAKLIKEISNRYNLKKVYVEGGYGNIDTSWLKQIKDENIRKQAIENLLDDGILTGSEYYKLTNNNETVELKGIDDEKIHKDNVKRLSWIISQQGKYEQVIEKVNKEIKILEKEYINADNKQFNNIIDEYLSGKTDSRKFYKRLIKYVLKINNSPEKYNNITAIRLDDYPNINSFITLRQISKSIDIKKVSQQLQIIVNDIKNRLPYSVYTRLLKETDNLTNGQKVVELITLLCKKENIDLTKYQALNFFLESNYITKNINPINLVLEERQLITEIRKALSYNNEEFEITFILDFNKYFEDYLKYKLTDADWKYFESEYETFRQLYGKYATIDRIKEIEQDFAQINKYYEINDKRNDIFVKKLLQDEKTSLISDKQRDCDDILKDSKEVIIAVTGGFHSSELEQLLASNDVNTIVITPKIYEDIKQANDKYIELINIQSRVTSQALSYTISSCATDSDKQKILLSITKDIIGDNSELLEKVLGEKINLDALQEPAENIRKKNEIRDAIEQTVEQVLKFVPQDGLKSFIVPDIDEIMLPFARELVSYGIFFSEGMIFDIENSKLKGKDLNGIPAEIYSRMLPSLQQALFKVAIKEAEITGDDDIEQDMQDLYEDTGATESSNIYLEDIKDNPEKFISLMKDSIVNNKLMVLRVFRNPINIDSLDKETQKRLYRKIRDMFFKIYATKLLYTDNFVSQPGNKAFINFDIHFFLLEILENSFMHGNKGLDKPIYVYMDLNEQNEIKTLKIYNKNSQDDDNFPMRFIRMKLALLGGQHKSNVLMKQNPYRTFETNSDFKNKFYKVSSDIRPFYDDDLAKQLEEYKQQFLILSVFDPLKRRNVLFYKLSKFPQIWEEIFFRFVPTSLSFVATSYFSLPILTVPLGLLFFAIYQNQFVKAHNVSQWIEQNNLSWSTTDILKATLLNIFPSKELKNKFKKFTQTRQIKYQTMQRTISTILLSLTYISTIIFATNFQFVIFATIAGIFIHKYFNYILKVKLNIFEKNDKPDVPTIYQFLSKRTIIDLADEKEKQLLTDILNEYDLSEVEAMALCEKINLEDLQQTKYLLEVFERQKKVTNYNRKVIMESLAKNFNANSDAQLLSMRTLLLNKKFFVIDDVITTILVDKLVFDNLKQFNLLKDFLANKIYKRNLQTMELNLKILEKIDINDIYQISLLDLFDDINDETLCYLISKVDFFDKNVLQNLFKIISKYNLVQKTETFELILNKTDLRNNIDFKLIRDIVLNADYIGAKTAENLFSKMDFTNKNHMYLIRSIAKKRNIDLSIIENFTKYMDINDSNHLLIINDIIRGFFNNNTIDSGLIFYEKIEKKLKALNVNQMNEKELYVLQTFTEELIESIQKELIKIQGENIRADYNKMTVNMFVWQNLFNELKELVNLLSDQNFNLSQQAQNNLQEIKERISFIEEMIEGKVTIEAFARKYGFDFSQQSPTTYIDSDRYSFTELLSLFPEKVLKRKIKKHSPTYFIEKNEINKESLKILLGKFDVYMKLLDENVYVINKLSELKEFDYHFEEILQHISLMIDYLSVFDVADARTYGEILENILEKISNKQTTVEEQKQFSMPEDVYGINTINKLVNKIHQKASLDFLSNIRKTTSLSLSRIQNVFVAKDDRMIAAYNLSQKQIDHNIKRLLLMLIENPDFSTYDKSQIFIKDNIFLWNGLLGDHSARVLIDFSKENKNIFVDFSEGEKTTESAVRISALKKIFGDFGFNVNLYDNNNSLVATIDKDTGLTNDIDICDLAQKAIIALNNSASLYRTDIPKQVLEAATLGVMDIYKKNFFIQSVERNIIDTKFTKVNSVEFFNRILSHLQMPLVPLSEPGMIKGFFFMSRTEILGQSTIDKYINNPIEQAFADGYLKINETGYLEKDNEYNPLSLIAEKLNSFINDEIGSDAEKEMLYNGAILSQVSEQDLNLKTCGQVGEYILKTGYIKLIDGTLDNNTKGDFLSVRVLIDRNGIIRYSESELIGFPENIGNKLGRKELNSYQLRRVLLNEGYDITDTEENFTESELLNYRIRLESDIPDFKMPVAYGATMSSSNEKDIFVGAIGSNIFVDKFATPENVNVATEYPISLFTCGSYSSHAGIVLREYKKTAMVINDSQFSDNKLKIKFYRPKGNVLRPGKFEMQETEEFEIELQPNDIVLVDTKNNKLLLFENKLFKNSNGENILFELQRYIDNYNIIEIKEFIEKYKNNELLDKIIEYIHYQAGYIPWLKDILSNYIKKNINEVPTRKAPIRIINKIKLIANNYLPHVSGSNVYRFGEKESLNKSKIGAKAANQSKLFSNIEQLRINTGVENVAVPNGIAIDYTVLENLLGREYRNLYKELEEVVQSNKDETTKIKEVQIIASKIRQLINDIGNSRIKKYIGKTNLKDFKNGSVIVRSSGINEDGGSFSAAGIADSFGDVNYENIPNSVINVLSSFFSKKAVEYMLETKTLIKPAVLIEDFIQADKAGIMMSEDTNGNRIIQVVNGQGEDIVSGREIPATFTIDIASGEKIDGDYTNEKTITKENLEQLTKILEYLERLEGYPVDVEFVIRNNIIYIVQVRPITTLGYSYYPGYDVEYTPEYDEDVVKEEQVVIEEEFDKYPKAKKAKEKREKKLAKKKSKEKKKKAKSIRTTDTTNDDDIRQPEGLTLNEVIKSFTKLSQSKKTSDKTLELNIQQTKNVLLNLGLTKEQVEKIDFNDSLPDYIVAFLKSRNTQITGTKIDPTKSLIENLKEHPILFSLAIQTLIRIYDINPKKADSPTLGDLLSFIEQRYWNKLYEATCTDLRGFFGEIYSVSTLIAGIIPDKRAGPIIIRPQLAELSNARGYDIYNPVDGTISQIKIGGSGIVHEHFKKYWSQPSNISEGIIAIPVLTTKNVKKNSFPTEDRVQGLDVSTETVIKFANEFISALYGISYKKDIPEIRDIKLKDLINSFKGVSTEKNITVDELIDLLTNKNQVVDGKVIQRRNERQQNIVYSDNLIDFNRRFIDVSNIFGRNVVVRTKANETHVLYIDRENIFVNEENRKVLEEKEYPLYGINAVEFNEQGIIENLLFDEGTQISTIKVDGEPVGNSKNNISFSDNELQSLYSDTKTDGYIDVYLDGDVDEMCHLIKKAATEKKLIVFHLFEKGFKTSELTPIQLLDIYKKVSSLISSRFKLSDIFPGSPDAIKYTDYGLDFFLDEILKNSFIHANAGNIEQPIAMYIKLDKNNEVKDFSIYNKQKQETMDKNKRMLAISSHLILTGNRKSTDIMKHNPVREYDFNEEYYIKNTIFQKAEVKRRPFVDMDLYRLEQNYKNSRNNTSMHKLLLQTKPTLEKLYEIGLKKYTKQYLKKTGKLEKDLTVEELYEIEEIAENYRFTFSGIINGVFLETFALFSKDFIFEHNQNFTTSKAAVWGIRILSVGIGVSLTMFLPFTSAISFVLGLVSIIISSNIMHLLWNIFAVKKKNIDAIKNVIVNYKQIKSQEIEQLLKEPISDEQNIKDIYIVEDIEKLKDKYTLINTGTKIDGQSIFKVKKNNKLIYGAIGVPVTKIAKTINKAEHFKKDIKSMLSIHGQVEIDGIIKKIGTGIEVSDDILEIGEIELQGKTQQQVNEFISSALEVKRAMGIMYSQKTIIDLKKLTGSELLKAVENGRARKVVTEEQYSQLQLNTTKMFELKENGIEIYVASNEIKDDYAENGISGQIIRENGKSYIYDYYSMEKTELDEITDQKELANLEQKILNSDNLIMIDIEILKKTFQGRNPIESFSRLGALTGKIKITMGLGNIKMKDIENIGYNIDFDRIPEMEQNDIRKLMKATSKEEIIDIIGQNNEFAIILNSLKDENVNKFKELIIERILTKKVLTDTATAIEGIELQDKKLEIMLGKFLLRQFNYTDKETIKEDLVSARELIKTLETLKELDIKQKALETTEQQVLVNTIIQLILYDGQRVKGKQIQDNAVITNISTYRAMLAAA